MIDEILLDAEDRMEKSLASLDSAFNKSEQAVHTPVFLIIFMSITTVRKHRFSRWLTLPSKMPALY